MFKEFYRFNLMNYKIEVAKGVELLNINKCPCKTDTVSTSEHLGSSLRYSTNNENRDYKLCK